MSEQSTELSPRTQAFNTFITDNRFNSWGDLLRCMRDERKTLIEEQLSPLPANERKQRFQGLAGQLSGSESAYAVWVYNLFGDDPTRELGTTTGENV